MRHKLAAILLFALLFIRAGAQDFDFSPKSIEVSVVPGANHYPILVPLTVAGGYNFSTLAVSSDSAWVTPTVVGTSSAIRLSFATSGLINSTYTATITVSNGSGQRIISIKAYVAALNAVSLRSDASRSRVYALHQDGTRVGSVVVFQPSDGSFLGNITVGKRPSDFSRSNDGNELFVINSESRDISIIDLNDPKVTESIALPVYTTASGHTEPAGNIETGPGNVIYYTDGAWEPTLYAINRTTKGLVQGALLDNGNGFGDIVVSPDRQYLYGWAQIGWNAGLASSYAMKYKINGDGTLSFVQRTVSEYPNGIVRDPIDAPALMSSDGASVILKKYSVSPSDLTTQRQFSSPVYSITPKAELVATSTGIFDAATGNKLKDIPETAPVQAMTEDYSRFVYYSQSTRELKTLDLLQIGANVAGSLIAPINAAIVTPPSQLQWTAAPGAIRYRVFLGTSREAVSAAGAGSSLILDEVTGTSLTLLTTLPAGNYFWRVDPITTGGSGKGNVYSFTVSSISTSETSIGAYTVKGVSNAKFKLDLSSGGIPRSWTASTTAPWLSFTNASGTTPATLELVVNSTNLTPGDYNTTVSISAGGGTVSIPINLTVDPLNLTVMYNDPGTDLIYAISEASSSTTSRAYLLEIDARNESIKRIRRVGSSATDLAIHHPDGRVYVTNWRGGSLLAVNLGTFEIDRTYPFTPFGGMGYGENDVFRISAGGAGRLVVEEQDQWIDVRLYDTVSGTYLGRASLREGGGSYNNTKRYYYHGENNSSGASIYKFDTVGDVFAQVGPAPRPHQNYYYGSRTVVVSENGNRVFWGGKVFDSNLSEEWSPGVEFFSATADGKIAAAQDAVYDVSAQKAIFGMPISTRVSAINSTNSKLAVQIGEDIRFYPLSSTIVLTPPTLTYTTVSSSTITLTWNDNSLETGWTLQYRKKGTTAWTDAPALAANLTSYDLGWLTSSTTYEIRIKPDGGTSPANWSNVVTVKTSDYVYATPYLNTSPMGDNTIYFSWSFYDNVAAQVERSSTANGPWTVIRTGILSYGWDYDTGLAADTTYYYRVKLIPDSADPVYSYVASSKTYSLSFAQAPLINLNPTSRSAQVGSTIILEGSATGSPSPTYQWYKDNLPISGATQPTYQILSVQQSSAGSYQFAATNTLGTTWSQIAVVSVTAPNTTPSPTPTPPPTTTPAPSPQTQKSKSELINLSVRARAGQGNQTLIVGFNLAGEGTKSILVRGVGPSLSQFGLSEFLKDPILNLYSGQTVLATNDNWVSSADLIAKFKECGAFLYQSQSKDAAILQNFAIGGFTGHVTAASSETGIALIELYDAQLSATNSRLVNLSARAQVGKDADVLIAGFTIDGNDSKTVLIRGVGPTLAKLGVGDLLANPMIELHSLQNNADVLLASNDNWGSSADATTIKTTSASIGAFALDEGSKDAVILRKLPPGAYTAVVKGVGNTSGVALVELYATD